MYLLLLLNIDRKPPAVVLVSLKQGPILELDDD
jgi:hypothetical protein